MSQKKTQFPGMENAMSNNPYSKDAFGGESTYQGGRGKETRFPNMDYGIEEQEDRHDPIVGFLFSVSRTLFGEYWPLYVGKNLIGRDVEDVENSVNLLEGTVSGEHAALVIEQYTNPNVTIAVLENKGSKNGTFINGKPVFYGRTEECKNGDILRFGSSYECMLILFDIREIGLKKAEGFIPVDGTPFMENEPYKGMGGKEKDEPYFDIKKTEKGTKPLGGGAAYKSPGGLHTEIM